MSLTLQNSLYTCSYYTNLYSSKAPAGELDINQLIEVIRYGYLKKEIVALRAATSKEAYRALKQQSIPAVTLSGIFTERKGAGFQKHSGLIQVDIDEVVCYAPLFEKIQSDPYTYVAFKSPGGKGIKVIVKINPSKTTHLEQFYALEKYYKESLGVQIDTSCKDIARCMLLSHDPELYCHPFSAVFEECYVPKKEPVPVVKRSTHHLTTNAQDTLTYVEALASIVEAQQINITETHKQWIQIGFALCQELEESGRSFFHRLSQTHPEYKSAACDRKYSELLKTNNGTISMGTLKYWAKQYNIHIRSSKPQSVPKRADIPVEETPAKSLLTSLKETRRQLAREHGVAQYKVFYDGTLKRFVENMPKTEKEFLIITGVGPYKMKQYVPAFSAVIEAYRKERKP